MTLYIIRKITSYLPIFKPRHTLVAGYYVFTLAARVSGRPSVVRTSVRTLFPFDNFSIYKRISFKLCICICTNNVWIGIVNGHISIIYHGVMALVNVQKCGFFGLWFLYYLAYHDKTAQNDQSNNSSYLSLDFFYPRLPALALGLYTYIKS